MIKEGIKRLLKKNKKIFCGVYYLLGHNLVQGKKNNKLVRNYALMKDCRIIINGYNNEIYIADDVILNKVIFQISGNHNKIYLSNGVKMNEGGFYIEDDDNEIILGKGTTLSGKVQMSCTEGTSISIEDDCMFSANIEMRTSDAHSIINSVGKRINASENILIGAHCWIGNTVIILKGVEIQPHSIIGAGSVVTKKFDEGGVVIAGNPAHVIKENIDWLRERIKVAEEIYEHKGK